MSIVLDSSITIARVIPEECAPSIEQVFIQVATATAWAPELWRIEVANALSMCVKRNRMSLVERNDILAQLRRLSIQFDNESGEHVWGQTLRLADVHQLTLYEATYLELALRRSLPLATLDRELRAAAQAEGVPLLGL